ncbi:hypothetical protein Tco_1162747 [Tanacetum coccineum]
MHATTTPPFPAVAAAVVGRGWRVGAVRRQTTIVVAVGRRYSHHSSLNVRVGNVGPAVTPGLSRGAQPLDATAGRQAEMLSWFEHVAIGRLTGLERSNPTPSVDEFQLLEFYRFRVSLIRLLLIL